MFDDILGVSILVLLSLLVSLSDSEGQGELLATSYK